MEKIFTERAHLMCPHMYFGIAMIVARALDEVRIKKSFETLAENHPFLKAVLGYLQKENSYFYDITGDSKVDLIFGEAELTGIDDEALMRKYHRLTGYDWDIRKEGFLKAVVWKAGEETAILLIFHHLLADGRGALNLARELADQYAEDRKYDIVAEKLISSAEDLPKASKMPLISRMLVEKANRDWDREGWPPLRYPEYHEFADAFLKTDRVRISFRKSSAEEVTRLAGECRAHSVTINDHLMAEMYLGDQTDKIIIAKDIRDSLPFYRQGALGNYATAFSVEIKTHGGDLWTLAQAVHGKVQKAISDPRALYLVLQCYANLRPEVLDAAFMAAKGAFRSKSAGFIGKMFFGFDDPRGYSITNLGKIESTSIVTAAFIPPASPAIRKTVGVLTVNGGMIACTNEREGT